MVTGDIHQPIVMRDFLGLGSLASPSIPEEDEEITQPEAGFRPSLDAMAGNHSWRSPAFANGHPAAHFSYMKNTVWNERSRMLSFGNSVDEKYMEGSANSAQAPQLMPGAIAVSGQLANVNQYRLPGSSQNPTQLTIFYGGSLNVYENIPSGKAHAIMQMAASACSSPADMAALTSGEHNSRNERMSTVGDEASHCSPPSTPSDSSPLQPMVPKALPLARKASLVRFLEKRKERMQVTAPYTKKGDIPTGNPITVPNYSGGFSTVYADYSLQPMVMSTRMNGHMMTLNRYLAE